MDQNFPSRMVKHCGMPIDIIYKYAVCYACYEIFRGDTKDEHTCKCKEPRCEASSVLYKCLHYRTISDWLRRLFACKVTAEAMPYAARRRREKMAAGDTSIEDHQDGCLHAAILDDEAWSDYDMVIVFFTDGFEPGTTKALKGYSIWPGAVVCMDLPPEIRYEPGPMTTLFAVPGQGPHSSGFHMTPALNIMAEEAAYLETHGVEVYDAARHGAGASAAAHASAVHAC